jgi:hypothetical protein
MALQRNDDVFGFVKIVKPKLVCEQYTNNVCTVTPQPLTHYTTPAFDVMPNAHS